MRIFLGDKISQLIPKGPFQPPIQRYESILTETEKQALFLVNPEYIDSNSGLEITVYLPNRQYRPSIEVMESKNELEMNFSMFSQRASVNYKYLLQKEIIQGLFREGTLVEYTLPDSPWPNGFGLYSAYNHASQHFEDPFLLLVHKSYRGQIPLQGNPYFQYSNEIDFLHKQVDYLRNFLIIRIDFPLNNQVDHIYAILPSEYEYILRNGELIVQRIPGYEWRGDILESTNKPSEKISIFDYVKEK